MKTGFWDRVLVYLYVLITLIIMVAVALRAFGLDLIGMLITGLRANAPGLMWRLILIGICALVGVLGVYVFVMVMPSRQKKGNFISINSDNGGQVLISLPAIRQMANQAISAVTGLQDVNVDIGEDNDGVMVNVAMDIESGVHVPSVTMNIQNAIKRNIERNCGVAVRSVIVTVNEVRPVAVDTITFEQSAEAVEIMPVDADIAAEEIKEEAAATYALIDEEAQEAEDNENHEEAEIALSFEEETPEEETQEEA